MTSTLTTVEIVAVNCGAYRCGIWFGLERHFYNARRKDGQKFYCPNGHFVNWSDSENDKLRAEKLRLESSLDYYRGRAQRAEKEVVTHKQRASRFKNDRDRIKNRIANGVCPCCNRHFVNVERHMKTRHPDFKTPGRDEEVT